MWVAVLCVSKSAKNAFMTIYSCFINVGSSVPHNFTIWLPICKWYQNINSGNTKNDDVVITKSPSLLLNIEGNVQWTLFRLVFIKTISILEFFTLLSSHQHQHATFNKLHGTTTKDFIWAKRAPPTWSLRNTQRTHELVNNKSNNTLWFMHV